MPCGLDLSRSNSGMSTNHPNPPHEEPGLSPLEFARLQDELQKSNAELAAANAALRESERELEGRVQERTRELSTLLRVSNNITTTLELETLLGLILDELKKVVEYEIAVISILESDDELSVLAARGDGLPTVGTRVPLNEHANTRNMLRSQSPAFVPDLRADTPLAARMRNNLGELFEKGLNSWMSAPLVYRGKSIGTLNLAHLNVNYYDSSRVELTMAFANQAAVAIENARLYEQTRQLAALEERQKLARELHDSVSQALYGIVLGARTARTLVEREPAKAIEPLDYILSLSEAGLAEMRALIFELRPESLQTEGLIAAVGKLVNALGSRHQIEVQMEAGDEPQIPLETKEAVYRIAQEALNNVAKHARAKRVHVKLVNDSDSLTLQISDDGIGFDTTQSFPGHLGLQSMNERAKQFGGEARINSAMNQGTEIHIRIPLRDS